MAASALNGSSQPGTTRAAALVRAPFLHLFGHANKYIYRRKEKPIPLFIHPNFFYSCSGHTRPVPHLQFSPIVEDDQFYLISACKGDFLFRI
jgi:hypothetical protein